MKLEKNSGKREKNTKEETLINARIQLVDKEKAKGKSVGGINKNLIDIYNLTIWHKVMKKDDW